MRHKLLLLTLSCTVALAAPAAAQTPPLTIDDPCGDNSGHVVANGERTDLPRTERADEYDIDGATLESTSTGIRVTFTQCAVVGESDTLGGFRGLGATLPGRCHLSVAVSDEMEPGGTRQPSFSKTCYRERAEPIGGDEADQRFDIVLPNSAIKVSGRQVIVDVDRAGLTGEAAAALAPGAVWGLPGVVTVEATNLWGFGFVYGEDWGYNGPMGSDGAYQQSDFVVG